jgi:PadR family transcriptional regulator, regulatory protein PadR
MLRIGDKSDADVLENLRSELRRGSLIVAVLAELRCEQYGYTLRKSLEKNGLFLEEGTLYPLLRRLETQGLLSSEWREADKRNKRFYRLSPQGELMLTQLLIDWEELSASLHSISKQARTAPTTEDGSAETVPPPEQNHGTH